MAIIEKQTECLRIITIGYLKNFIGDHIKDSNGVVVHINEEAKADYANDEYCPTYSELTGGTLIPNHVRGEEGPEGDVDGIVVNNIFYNDGVSQYAENQEVNQKDLSLVYTVFNGFSIDADRTTISECGGDSTLSYSYNFIRNTKYMTDACAITSLTQTISETQDGVVTWTTSNFGGIAYPTFTVGKNGEISANSRTTIVTGKVTFQGTDHTDTVTISQNALTGDYISYEGRHYTGVTVYATTPTTFDCNGGDYGIRGTGYYFDRYNWVDSCGYEYVTVYQDRNGSEDAGTNSGHFNEVICPSGDTEHPIHLSDTLSIEYHGISDSSTFTLDCDDKNCTCSEYDSQTVYTAVTVNCANGSVTVPGQHTHYTPNGYDASGNCIYAETIVDDSYSVTYACNPTSSPRDVDTTGRGNVTQAAGPCCCDGAMSVTGVSCFDHNAHTSAIIGRYTASQGVTNIHINSGDYPNWLTNVSVNTSNRTVRATMGSIPCETSGRDGIVIISFSMNGEDCSVSFNVCQEANSEICPCTSYTYSATCKVDTTNLVCSDNNIELNLTDVPCNSVDVQLSLDVWRKCLAPHPDTDWIAYNDYSVVWSAPSGCFMTLENPTDKVLTVKIPANCTNSSRSCTITATCTVGGEVKTCSSTITQQAGPCYNCNCEAYTYSATCDDITFDACGGEGTVDFKLYRKCTSPYAEASFIEEWYGYTSVDVVKSDASIDADFSFNEDEGTYLSRVHNCESSADTLGTVTLTFKSGSTALASVTANVNISAGPCCWPLEAVFNTYYAGQEIPIYGGTGTGGHTDYGKSGITVIQVDGVTLDEVPDTYRFDTAGEHIVRYGFRNPDYIPMGVFYGVSNISSISILDGVRRIDDYVFSGCSLTSITIPNSVVSIGKKALYGTNIYELNIPSSVTTIESGVCSGCSNLTSVTFEQGSQLTSIDQVSFSDCNNLESINIPDSVTTIADGAFFNCYSLTNVNIPSGVTDIGTSAFYNCNLESINIPSGVTTIKYETFGGCGNLTSVTFEQGSRLASIDNNAFNNCGLESINIPSGVTSIGDGAFQYCYNLISISMNRLTPPTLGSDVFDNIGYEGTLYVPNGATNNYNNWVTNYLGEWTIIEMP